MSSRRKQPQCEERASLWEFAEGRLGASARQRVQEHLDVCAMCRQELVALQATRTLLSEASERSPAGRGPGEESAPAGPPHAGRARFRGLKPGPLLALAAGVGACLVALQASQAPSPRPAVARPAPASIEEALARSAPDALERSVRPERPSTASTSAAVERKPAAPVAPDGLLPAARAPAAPAETAPAPASPGAALAAAEGLYLQRAEEGLGDGACEDALEPLDGFARGGSSGAVREKARLLRARCLKKLGRGIEADAEYRRYLQEHPSGAFSGEARSTVAH